MKPYEFLEQSQYFVYEQITEETEAKKHWYCDNCKEKVAGIERYTQNGPDDVTLGEVICNICGELLWED